MTTKPANPDALMTATRPPLAARLLAAVVSVVTGIGALFADVISADGAAQHLHNDRWPPHAKFHDAQYVAMSILLGIIGLALIFGPRANRDRFLCAVAALSTPWFGMLAAFLFPGTAAYDPEHAATAFLVGGMPGQIFLASILLVFLAIATIVTLRSRAPGMQT